MKDTHEQEHTSVAKVVELIGSSPVSWEKAAANALDAAGSHDQEYPGY